VSDDPKVGDVATEIVDEQVKIDRVDPDGTVWVGGRPYRANTDNPRTEPTEGAAVTPHGDDALKVGRTVLEPVEDADPDRKLAARWNLDHPDDPYVAPET
jgi:hypothetical protein